MVDRPRPLDSFTSLNTVTVQVPEIGPFDSVGGSGEALRPYTQARAALSQMGSASPGYLR